MSNEEAGAPAASAEEASEKGEAEVNSEAEAKADGKVEAAAGEAQEYPFQAEVQKVLSLVIDSLYANKEVFLRELVSNASDALDKARFLQLTRDDVLPQEGEARIDIRLDDSARTLIVEDNGIGMTREEVIQNLGTIARSGSGEFLKAHAEAMKQKDKDAALRLIGQFGVGFYSAFMVAKRIDVRTRSMLPGSEPIVWRSTGAGSFTILPGERQHPGTEIILHLKEEYVEYAKAWRAKDVIKKYSDFVNFPVYVNTELANKSKALWAMPRAQITEEQHQEFYKHLTNSFSGEKPLLVIHNSIDAPVQFHALLYVPEKAPFDLFQKDRQALRLYAKRVLIMESCEKLTPVYLRFLRGVVDSEDISLNVSREMLQESRAITQIEGQLVKQVLKALRDLAENDPDKYADFWREFGKVLKEGIAIDWKNKDAIADLCRFESMRTDAGKLISLKQYVADMPADQKEIYFVTGHGRRAVEQSPHLEVFRKKGYDVLFLTDPIDEWVVQGLPEYDKRKLKSVAHGDVDLGTDDDDAKKEDQPEKTLEVVKKVLADKVKDVRFSKRLTDSASCLVADEGDPGANMERILRMIDERAKESKRILELNPGHVIVKNLGALAAKDPESPKVAAWSQLLLDQALLAEGVVEDPARLVKQIQDLLAEVSSGAVASQS